MTDIKMTNVPSLSIDKIVSELASVYCSFIKANIPIKNVPSVMLWGPPGVGKSQSVAQVARKIEDETDKKVIVTDVRLLLFNPIDLRGIPTSNADKTLAVWLKPKIFDMDESDSVVNILFLDEISAAPQSVQAAAYQITLDRVVGEHKLPDNCIVIAAGNRITDKSVSYNMPKALANRLLHIEIVGSYASWEKWARDAGISEKVLGFLSERKDLLMAFDPTSSDLAFPTPRSWEMVSEILNSVSDDIEKMYPMVAGLIGAGAAVVFREWDKIHNEAPSVKDIFDGVDVPVPIKSDILYMLINSMISYAKEHKDEFDKLENSIIYASKMPAEFSTILMRKYLHLGDTDKNPEECRQKVIAMPAFQKWLREKGELLNGSI